MEAICEHFCTGMDKEFDETELIGRFLKMKKEERSENSMPMHAMQISGRSGRPTQNGGEANYSLRNARNQRPMRNQGAGQRFPENTEA